MLATDLESDRGLVTRYASILSGRTREVSEQPSKRARASPSVPHPHLHLPTPAGTAPSAGRADRGRPRRCSQRCMHSVGGCVCPLRKRQCQRRRATENFERTGERHRRPQRGRRLTLGWIAARQRRPGQDSARARWVSLGERLALVASEGKSGKQAGLRKGCPSHCVLRAGFFRAPWGAAWIPRPARPGGAWRLWRPLSSWVRTPPTAQRAPRGKKSVRAALSTA